MGKYFAVSQFVTDFFNVLILVVGGIFLYKGIGGFNYGDYSAFIVSVGTILRLHRIWDWLGKIIL